MFEKGMQAGLLAALCAVALLSGCAKRFYGDAGSGAVPATPVPSNPPAQQTCVQGLSTESAQRRPTSATPTPTPTQPPLATVAIDSNPQGLTVEYDGSYVGTTPTSEQPPYSTKLHEITVLNGSGGQDYTVCYSQISNPNITVYYNRAADTLGKIASVQSSAARLMQRSSARYPSVQRPVTQADPAKVVTGALEVRYDSAQLRTLGVFPAVIETRAGLRSGERITPKDAPVITRVVRIPAGASRAALEARLRGSNAVLSVTPVHLRYLKTTQPIPTPSDPFFDPKDQWDMYDINMLNAWAYSEGKPAVAVAIIDTGLDMSTSNTMVHADLAPKVDVAESVLTPPDAQGNFCAGTQAISTGAAAVQDKDGHGTNVAGIALATGNNAAGFAGIAWNARLQVYKIFDANGNACTTDEAKAIYDAVANGAKVINLSLGSAEDQGPDPTEEDAVEYAIAHGVFIAAAAGNERAQGAQNIDYPGAYPGVMSVGATGLKNDDGNDATGATEYVASYSNSGPGLGIVAPGGDPCAGSTSSTCDDPDPLHWITNLYSTTGNPPCSTPSACDVEIAGTSQATPHVAGAAALLLSVNPNLTPRQIYDILTASADDIADPNQGHGRLDVYRALAIATGDPNPPAYKPAPEQFIAFAYSNSGAVNAAPQIVDETFKSGIVVNADGTFRIADIPTSAPTYKIGVWYDANGDGVVDAGDLFGATGACSASAACAGADNISVQVVTGSQFALP